MKTITINKVTGADLPSIAELASVIWHEHYTPIIGSEQVEYMLEKYQSVQAMAQQIAEGVSYFTIVLDTNLVGYLSFYPKNKVLFLSKIYISSQQRGRGLGRYAIAFVAQQAKLAGLDKVRLTVNKHNTDSIAAYQSMGFKTVDEVVVDIGAGFVMDDYVMEFFVDNC